jgi:alkylation response protein AidB-like acyl-CoA dehydrogenase
VDLDLTADQELLRDTTERFIESAFPLAAVRARVDGSGDPDESYARQAAELGWFAALAPEDLGGGSVSGFGVLDAAIFAELRGRRLQPGGFVDTNVVVAALVADGSDEQQTKVLPALIGGESTAAWAVAGPTGDRWGAAGVEAVVDGAGFRLDGTKVLVPEAHLASWLLVSAGSEAGLCQFLVAADHPGVTIEVLDSFDRTRRFCEVRFDEVRVDASTVVGRPGEVTSTFDHQVAIANVLSLAETVGALDHLFDLTVEYCGDRIAFGRPIGSFQAVKHQLADSAMFVEMCKAAAVSAARDVQASAPRASESVSLAKSFIAEAALDVVHACWQNFGGIAYTWEHDFHLYFRRIATDASLYGTTEWHRERICQLEGI